MIRIFNHSLADRNMAETPVDEKPFRLAKSFSLIAIVLIFAAVLTLSAVVSRQAEVIITKRVEDDTLKLMENLNHQMYQNFLKKVSNPQTGKSRLRNPEQQAMLHEVITNTIYGFDLKRVLIYDARDGRVVYDTNSPDSLNTLADDMRAYREAVKLFAPAWPVLPMELVEPFERYILLLRQPEPLQLNDLDIPAQAFTLESLRSKGASPDWPEMTEFEIRELGQEGMAFRLWLQPKKNLTMMDSGLRPSPNESGPLKDVMGGPTLATPKPPQVAPNWPGLASSPSTAGPARPNSEEEDYLEHLRSQTVFRYEGGSYRFLNFFPEGSYVLRAYKAMEDQGYKNSIKAVLCLYNATRKSGLGSGEQAGSPLPEICRKNSMSGILEVDRDLTPEYRQIARLQYFALSMALMLALVLTVALRWVVGRGEAILTKRNLERQMLRERLDQAERLAGLGSMVATVAHEIRNPLGIIHSTADLLNRFLSKEPDRAKLAQAIVEEANRLSDVVTEFLDFARPPSPKLAPTVVEEVLEEILAFLEITLARAGVEVRTEFRAEETPIPGDANMLHRSFLNILINAIQAMDDGGLIRIVTRLEKNAKNEDCLAVIISDTGPGLSEETSKKMFSPFYTTKAKGTGLGLVIVRNIIEAHGGEIELKNGPPPPPEEESGPGLVVTIRLKK